MDGTSTGDIWPRYTSKDMKYLLIKTAKPNISEKPFKDEYDFWSELPLTSNMNYIREYPKAKIEL